MNAGSLYAPTDQPEKERERERMIDMGRPSGFGKRGPKALFFKRYFYTLPYTQREMKDARSYRVSPNIPAVLPLSKPGFFPANLSHK